MTKNAYDELFWEEFMRIVLGDMDAMNAIAMANNNMMQQNQPSNDMYAQLKRLGSLIQPNFQNFEQTLLNVAQKSRMEILVTEDQI